MFALPSATPMKLSSTEDICSREISLSSAIAMPSFCTSRASSCLSTFAASCSPRLMSRIAARCVPARSPGLLAIGGDPILHDLRGPLRILPDQRAGCRDLLLKTGLQLDRRTALLGEAYLVARGLLYRYRPCRFGERFHERAQDEECHQQHQRRADDLLPELGDPRSLPDRQSLDRPRRRVRLEGLIEDVDLITAIVLEADGLAHELREALDVLLAHRARARLAVGIRFLPVVEHHA